MKILFINLPYYGHVVPTIGIVQELIAKGCEVTYMLPWGWEDTIQESGAKFAGYKNHKQLSEQIQNAYDAAAQMVEQFDMIVYEQFFFPGKHLAETYQKPVVRIFTAPVADKVLMDEYISAGGPLGIFRYKWIARAWTKDIAKHCAIPMKTDNWLDEIIDNPPELNLVYTLREYQPYVEKFPAAQYKFLGPSIYERQHAQIDFVKRENPVVYISLGTVVKGAKQFFQCCVDAFRDLPVDVVIAAGKTFDIGKMKHIPDNVHIYTAVPQTEVLCMADVFVTHGGMNSISEALVYGVPMIVLPFMADQPVNARQVEALGLGRCMDYKTIHAQALKEAVLSVLSDNTIKENLANAQNWIAQAPGNKGGAELILEYYREWGECT
ncbi:MAG: hypothetical protein J6A81_07540 [Peptococcaceae bacterium]|nr:hypothetical protein [Peptococcaceae bacterium]